MSLDSTDNLSGKQLSRLLAVGADGASRRRVRPGQARRPVRPGQAGSDADTEAGPFARGEVVDEFRIIEEVGRGGMCVVYKAHQKGLRRLVALKALRPSLAQKPAVARRFRRESILAANLRHANIVPIFSHDLDDAGRPYFTMEFVDGESIARRVSRDGPMSPKAALGVAVQACDALGKAHEAGIIHRDVTPRNILLEERRRVRLVDFGIAQDTTGHLAGVTRTGCGSAGTLGFMSPEQNLARPLDGRTDIFSLGMTLYYMLTGREAYRARNGAELALAFQAQKPRPPTGGALGRIVMKMIAVDLADRYQNCDELAADLAACRASRRIAGASTVEPLARAAALAAVLAGVALAAYALGPLACRSGAQVRHGAAVGAGVGATSRPIAAEARAARTAPAAGAATQRVVAPPPGAAPPRAVVQWAYQPRAGKSFNDAGVLTGRTTLDDQAPLSLGLFLFDPLGGLVPYSPRNGATADFRIQVDGRQVHLRRDAAADGNGCLLRATRDAYAATVPPQQGYQPFFRHALRAEMVLFFRCAKGGCAKLRVVSVE